MCACKWLTSIRGDGACIAFYGHTYAVAGLEVVEKQVEELLETLAVVLHLVIEEMVDDAADGVVFVFAGGNGMGFPIVAAFEHIAVVELEVVGGRCG